jgi:GT2 family glycosyltransferase
MELSVLIVNYNAEAHLKNCLESLFETAGHLCLEVIVADNASRDTSLEMLAKDFPQVRVMDLPENLGFAPANNLMLREAKGRYLLLLNNDTLVPSGSIETMLRIMEERPQVGVLGPLTRNEDGSVQISYGRMISFHAELIQKVLSAGYEAGNPLFRRHVARKSKKEAYPDWVSGACLMLRASVLEETGELDGKFFMYAEDVDFCYRVRQGGFRVLYTPEAEIVHLRGRSAETSSEKTALEYRRSQLYFYSKHYGRSKVILLKSYLLAKLAFAWLLGGVARRALHSRLLALVWSY